MKTVVKLFLFLTLLLIIASAFLPGVREAFSPESIESFVASAGLWGPLLIVAVAIGQVFLGAFPSPLIIVLAVALYGALGGIIGYVALLAASLVGYALGRLANHALLERFEDSLERWEQRIDRYGFLVVLASRASPVLSLDTVSIAAGAVRMSLPRFMIATAIGLIPLALLAWYYGDTILEAVVPAVIYTVVSLAAIGVFVWWDQRSSSKRTGQ